MTLSSTGVAILKVNCFFSRRTRNSYGGMTGYLGSNKIKVNRTKNDNRGSVLIVDAVIDDRRHQVVNPLFFFFFFKKYLFQNFCKYLKKKIFLTFGEYATRV